MLLSYIIYRISTSRYFFNVKKNTTESTELTIRLITDISAFVKLIIS